MAEAGERPASVKMTMDLTEYLVSLKKMQAENKRAGEEGAKKFALIGKGADAAKRSLGELGGSMKQGLHMAASFGGAFSLAAGVKSAVQLDARYRQLAFRAGTVNGQLVDQRHIHDDVSRAAAKTTRTNEELVGVYDELFTATGDLDFSRRMLETIGTTATATGEDLGTLTNLADQLHTKFGVGAEAMQDTFAQVYAGAQKGGPSFSQFGEVVSSVGAELMAAGLDGKQGLGFMIGALNATDDAFKSLPAQVKGLKMMLRGLGDKGELKAISKSLGIDPSSLLNEKDFSARLNKILKHGSSGVKALLGSMNEGEEKTATKILFTDPFEKALKDAHDKGLKGKAAIDAALKVVDKGIAEMGKTQLDGAALQKRAAEEMQSPQAQLRIALNRLNEAFEKPEIINAINELSKLLPKLAGVIGDVVGFAAKHPLMAGAGFVGGKVGMAAGGAMLQEVVSKVFEAHKKGGMAAAESLLSQMRGQLPATAVPVGGALGLAFKASAVAAAGAIGYEIGSAIAPYIIDPLVDEGLKKTAATEGGTEAAIANASGGGSVNVLEGRLKQLEEAIDTERGAKLGSGFIDQGIAAFGGPDVEKMSQDRIARGEQAASDLRWRIRQQREAGDPLSPKNNIAMDPDTIKGRVQLDRGAPREIAGAIATGLQGKVLTVRLVNGGDGGVTARNRGTRGPQQVPPPQPSGGV